ncbi:MAG: hypothetical protein HYZ75_19590 [Elusimicrobia bacterium]|nr:hypothetical protein [Elusimicrobiota bacterium]
MTEPTSQLMPGLAAAAAPLIAKIVEALPRLLDLIAGSVPQSAGQKTPTLVAVENTQPVTSMAPAAPPAAIQPPGERAAFDPTSAVAAVPATALPQAPALPSWTPSSDRVSAATPDAPPRSAPRRIVRRTPGRAPTPIAAVGLEDAPAAMPSSVSRSAPVAPSAPAAQQTAAASPTRPAAPLAPAPRQLVPSFTAGVAPILAGAAQLFSQPPSMTQFVDSMHPAEVTATEPTAPAAAVAVVSAPQALGAASPSPVRVDTHAAAPQPLELTQAPAFIGSDLAEPLESPASSLQHLEESTIVYDDAQEPAAREAPSTVAALAAPALLAAARSAPDASFAPAPSWERESLQVRTAAAETNDSARDTQALRKLAVAPPRPTVDDSRSSALSAAAVPSTTPPAGKAAAAAPSKPAHPPLPASPVLPALVALWLFALAAARGPSLLGAGQTARDPSFAF